MAVAGTTGLSDSETDQSSVYSYDRDAEYDYQMQVNPSDRDLEMPTESDGDVGDWEEVIESSSTFPSLSSTCNSLRFLLGDNDSISISNQTKHRSPFFRMTPIRRTGEVEIQIEMSTERDASLKDIEFGLMRSARGTELEIYVKNFHDIPLFECSCIFSVYGALFNSLKRNAFVNISYSQDRLALLRDVNRIGLKITKEGALEYFVNGQSLGIAAEEIYKLGLNKTTHIYEDETFQDHTKATFELHRPERYCSAVDYHPILWLPFAITDSNKATLIAGGKDY